MMNRFDFPIKQLSFAQKLDLMEMLWADMIAKRRKIWNPRLGMKQFSKIARLRWMLAR